MLKNSEHYTAELTEWEEEVLLPILTEVLARHKGKHTAITNAALRRICVSRGVEQTISEPRVRKVVEYIRHFHILEGLIADSNGYYLAANPEELKGWLDTMEGRINTLKASLNSGKRDFKRMTGLRQPNQYMKAPKNTPKNAQQNLFQ